MLVLFGGSKIEKPKEKPSEQGENQTATNSTQRMTQGPSPEGSTLTTVPAIPAAPSYLQNLTFISITVKVNKK